MFDHNFDPYEKLVELDTDIRQLYSNQSRFGEHSIEIAQELTKISQRIKFLTDAFHSLNQQNQNLHHRLTVLEKTNDKKIRPTRD